MSDQNTSDQHVRTDTTAHPDFATSFLPDPQEIPRTIFLSVCLLAYGTLVGLIVGSADLGFVVGLGAACGLGLHRIAMRRDWLLRARIPRP